MNAKSVWKIGAFFAVLVGVVALAIADDPYDGVWLAAFVVVAFLGPPFFWFSWRVLRQEPLPVWANLFWKEWREHHWKLAALTVIAIALNLLVVTSIVLPASAFFIGIGIAASERSRQTLPLMQQMPSSMATLAVVKLLVGTLVVWLPQLLAILLTLARIELGEYLDWSGIVPDSRTFAYSAYFSLWWIDRLFFTLVISLSLMLWFAAPGVNSTDEVRAAGISLVVCVALWTLWSVNFAWAVRSNPGIENHLSDFLPYALSAACLPGGIALPPVARVANELSFVWPLVILFAATHGVLACWYVLRFGRITSPGRNAREKAATNQQRGWLGAPYRSPLVAMLWKHWRQALPVMATAFAGAVLLSLVIFLSTLDSVPRGDLSWARVVGATAYSMTCFGALAGLVAGVGLTTTDLTAGLHTFWRSRPISPDLWFWSLFASGLAMLLIAFVIPLGIAAAIVSTYDPDARDVTVWCIAIVLLNYAFGIFSGCLTRHAVYGCLLGLAAFVTTYMIGIVALDDAEPSALNNLVGAQLLLVAGIAVVSWQLVRVDKRLAA